jgi:diacylglycerol O-acyltransferase/trehalose O-mycolyltransferase
MGEGPATRARLAVGALACAVAASLAAPGATAAGSAQSTTEDVATYSVDGAKPLAALRSYVRMMATLAVDSGYRPTVSPPLAGGKAACPPRRCRDYRVKAPSSVQVTGNRVRVILPVGYHRSPKKRYPVVFLFNGAVSAYDAWSRKTLLTSMSRSMPAIFVMPDGGFGRQLGMFTDWEDGTYDWETFHTRHVVPWVDRRFRTIKGARAAVGASVSALAAIGYAARHPGLFKAVLSISGMLDTRTLATQVVPQDLADAVGLNQRVDLTRVWGDPVLDADVWAAHNPADLAPRLDDVEVFVASGTGFAGGDPNDPIHTGYQESLIWTTHRTFLAALTANGVSYEARVAVGNLHDWPYFDGPMRWGLPRIIRAATAP